MIPIIFVPPGVKKNEVIIPNNNLLIDDSKKIIECLIKNHDYTNNSEVAEYKRRITK